MTTTTYDILKRAAELRGERRPFVLATVTMSRKPASARAGSRAIITRDGALFGWVGGACSQPVVVRHALEALTCGEPRIIRLSSDGDEAVRDGVIGLPMTCHSGGMLEIFLEPWVPSPRLIVVGDSPIAAAVAECGARVDFDVVAVADTLGIPQAEPGEGNEPPPFVVVATMGIDDEAALERALELKPRYLGMVGSRRRFAAIADYLRARGVADDVISRIRAPAGIDIRAETPQEIALSILAEVVATRRAAVPPVEQAATPPRLVIDPICGMTVDLATAKHTVVVDGQTYGFCCPACKRRFERERLVT